MKDKTTAYSCACGRTKAKWKTIGRCAICLRLVCSMCATKCVHCKSILCRSCSSDWCPCVNKDHKPKKPKLKRDWVGLRVVTKKELKNSYGTIPRGTSCKVTKNYGGLYITAIPCEHCNFEIHMTKVSESSVEIVSLWRD